MAKDFYGVLGVSKSASQDEIKQAYRKLSKELHPDKHKGDKHAEQKFKEVNEAYEILSNPQKRSQYDTFGSTGSGGGGFGGGGFNGAGYGGFEGFGDIFNDLFSQMRQQQEQQIGFTLRVPIRELGREIRQSVPVDLSVTCSECHGARHAPGSSMKTCKKCSGQGRITKLFFQVACPDCKGTGQVPEKACKKCKGDGEMMIRKMLNITIPAGAKVEWSDERGSGNDPADGQVDLQFTLRTPKEK